MPKKRNIELPNVTLISVAALNYESVVRALTLSTVGIKFGFVKIITPTKPNSIPKDIAWEGCPPLRLRDTNIDDYSHYVLYDLWKHVDTEFCLVIQGDGYVINPRLWVDEFLKYDYIGAPWPIMTNSYIDPFGNHQRVGNGGFSLRSKKLLEVPNTHHIEWDVNKSDFYRHMGASSLAEDGNICVHNRHVFEEAGCVFAPLEIAMSFSRELDIPEYDGRKTFGFHRYRREGDSDPF